MSATMNPFSAHGGYIVVEWGVTPTLTILDNTEYDIPVDGRVDDVTTSASAGWAEGLSKVAEVSCTVRAPETDTGGIELAGLPLHSKVTLWCRKGAMLDRKYDKIVGAIFFGFTKANDNLSGKARTVEFRFRFGAYTGNVDGSAGVIAAVNSRDPDGVP